MGEKGEIAGTLRALFWGLGFCGVRVIPSASRADIAGNRKHDANHVWLILLSGSPR